MYIWSENESRRGGQEVGSCLLKHFNSHLPENTIDIILYSDSCGGQNRNIKLTLLLMKFLSSHAAIESITQKFLVPGHSYNSCDRSFSIIEKAKKFEENLYTSDKTG